MKEKISSLALTQNGDSAIFDIPTADKDTVSLLIDGGSDPIQEHLLSQRLPQDLVFNHLVFASRYNTPHYQTKQRKTEEALKLLLIAFDLLDTSRISVSLIFFLE